MNSEFHNNSGNALISAEYSDTGQLVRKGELVFVDGNPGRVEEVCQPGTELARNYACEETGGLLILFDDGILELRPFGYFGNISRQW